MKRAHVTSLPEPKAVPFALADQNPLKALAQPEYIKRILVLFVFWFFLYWVQYPVSIAWNTYFTGEFGYSPVETTNTIALFGYLAVGVTVGAVLVRPFLNRVEQKSPRSYCSRRVAARSLHRVAGGPSRNFLEMSIGLLIVYVVGAGFTYQLMFLTSAESFPTASRSTGYSLTDGLGHIGGAIAPSILLPLTVIVGPAYAFPILGIPVVFAGVLVIAFIPRTVGKKLEEVNEALVGSGYKPEFLQF